MSKSRIATLASAFLLALVSGWTLPSGAEVPAGVTQQGRILDQSGAPLNGKVTIVFTVYDDPEASASANVLWSESQNITLDDGYFSTRLGDDASNRFPSSLFGGAVRYLGVQVGSDDELRPRERIGSVPYAFMASDAVGAIHPTSVTVNGTVVIDSAGNWKGNAVDRPFTSLLSQKSVTADNQQGADALTVTCDAGQKVTGGGCALAPGTTTDGDTTISEYALKSSYPSAANAWTCTCIGQDSCKLTAYAVCAKD